MSNHGGVMVYRHIQYARTEIYELRVRIFMSLLGRTTARHERGLCANCIHIAYVYSIGWFGGGTVETSQYDFNGKLSSDVWR